MNYNHNDEKMLARSYNGQGTLKVTLTDNSLDFEFEAPQTTLGDEVLYNIRSGNLFECSFAFTIPTDSKAERWYNDNGCLKREILAIDGLYDCAVVNRGAYGATSCLSRSLEKRGLQEEEINILDIEKRLQTEQDEEREKLFKELDTILEGIDKYIEK